MSTQFLETDMRSTMDRRLLLGVLQRDNDVARQRRMLKDQPKRASSNRGGGTRLSAHNSSSKIELVDVSQDNGVRDSNQYRVVLDEPT